MKVDFSEETLEVQSSDNCVEMEFGIRACDVGLIMQLLRNEMYKYPIDAICREIASNSRDANREVGKGSTPVEIAIVKNPFLESDFAINFSDVGPGISPDRMQNIFLNYGASTKRSTDEQTGGFGLGAKTPFAYTNTFCIETIYDCKKYVYVAMVKSGNKGRMYLMMEEECYDESGTTISIPIKEDDIGKFENAAYRATFFWKERPVYKNFTTLREVNKYEKILSTDDFTIVAEHRRLGSIEFVRNSHIVALLDGIPYEIDNPDAGTTRLNFALSSLRTSNISILILCHLNIGEVTISPNRETLQYNDKTLEKITESVNAVADILVTEGSSLIERTNTVMDRNVFLKFLKSNTINIPNIAHLRPFNEFTESELVLCYLGYRFSKRVDDEPRRKTPEENVLTVDGVRVDYPFSKIFPGLRLSCVSPVQGYSEVTKLRLKDAEVKIDFFSESIFLVDGKRNTRKERAFYQEHKRGMLLIEHGDILNKYPQLSMDQKRLLRQDYIDARRSLRKLSEYGVPYQLYSSLKSPSIKRGPRKRKEFRVFPLRLYSGVVHSVVVKKIEEGKLFLDDGRTVEISRAIYFPMDDLRKVKAVQRQFEFILFQMYYWYKHGKRPHVIYINKKDEGHLQGAQSVLDILKGMHYTERRKIANAVVLDFSSVRLFNLEGIKFRSKRYSKALKRVIEVNNTRDTLKQWNRHWPHFFVKEMEKYSDIRESIEILEEIGQKFMLLGSHGYSDNEDLKAHRQKYVDLFEQEMIQKGEIV